MNLIGNIELVNKTVNNQDSLEKYNLDIFDINTCASSCIIESEGGNISLSKWVTPKRTRSEPFARIYKTLGQMKSITVIPVIKDEGIDGDSDSFNPITLAWMNLLNIYIILVPYIRAEKHRNPFVSKITAQQFDNDVVKNKIIEILNFRSDAHHYNNKNMNDNFIHIFNEAIDRYTFIGKDLNVSMHNIKKLDPTNETFQRYLENKNNASISAAKREKNMTHVLEKTTYDKGLIEIKNFYDGKYFLTIDEVFYRGNCLVLREAKNSIRIFPSESEIMDAFFKCLLFVNIDDLKKKDCDNSLEFNIEILLTGKEVKYCNIFNETHSIERIKIMLKKSLPRFKDSKIQKLAILFFKFIQNTKATIEVGF